MVQREQAEEQLRRQCEELRVQSQKELQQVQEDLARLQKEFSQSLLQAESEKQLVRRMGFNFCTWEFQNQGLNAYPLTSKSI